MRGKPAREYLRTEAYRYVTFLDLQRLNLEEINRDYS
jgi:hypothetical protein